MASCPAYGGPICSLCCSLDARCGDYCKPHARLDFQFRALLNRVFPRRPAFLENRPSHYLLLILAMAIVAGAILTFLIVQESRLLKIHPGAAMEGPLDA